MSFTNYVTGKVISIVQQHLTFIPNITIKSNKLSSWKQIEHTDVIYNTNKSTHFKIF